MIKVTGFLTVLRMNYQPLCLNEKIGWCRRYSHNNNDVDNLIVMIIIIPTALHLKFIIWSGLCRLKEFKLG